MLELADERGACQPATCLLLLYVQAGAEPLATCLLLLYVLYVQAGADPQPRVLRCTVRELEDPRKMLDQAVADMQADLTKMRQAAAQARSQSPATFPGSA